MSLHTMSVIRSGPLGVRVIPILLFAFLWYGICQTIKDAIVWGGIANAAELRGFWPDLMVATAGFFVASLILRAVIEDTEAEARERIEQELGEFRPLIEAEKSRRDLERLRNAIGQGFREGIMVPEEVIEDAYPGTFSKREKIGATTKRRIVEMVPYEEARPFSRGIGKYTKPEHETRSKSGRHDTGRQYVPRKPMTVGWEPDLPAIRRGIVLDPFCGTATAGEVALKLGRHFIGIELYENYAQIAEDRCRQAHLLRSEYEARNPITGSTLSFDEAPNDTMPDEVQFDVDSGAGFQCEL